MKILLIIPYRGIGDLIFHIPLIRGLYRKYNSRINILTNQVNRAKNLLRNEKTVNKIFYLNNISFVNVYYCDEIWRHLSSRY